jgi:phage terminase Nu1 subunit (DNA packaging protein)
MTSISTKPARPPDEIRNKVGIAMHFGVSVKIVERWIAEGMPVQSVPADRHGEYEISTAAAWQWHLERSAARAGDLNLDAERARLAKEQADGQALKNAALRDSLLPAEEVVTAWREAQVVARRICDEMVTQVAPQLLADINAAATPEKAELAARQRLTRAIDTALTKLQHAFDNEAEDAI